MHNQVEYNLRINCNDLDTDEYDANELQFMCSRAQSEEVHNNIVASHSNGSQCN